MAKVKWLDRSLHYGPYVTLCTSEDEFKGVLKRLKCPDDGDPWVMHNGAAKCHTLQQDGQTMICVVCLPLEGHTPAAIASACTHEAVHVWQAHCREIGEDAPGDEMEAYAIQNISHVLIEEAFARQDGTTAQ